MLKVEPRNTAQCWFISDIPLYSTTESFAFIVGIDRSVTKTSHERTNAVSHSRYLFTAQTALSDKILECQIGRWSLNTVFNIGLTSQLKTISCSVLR